MKVIETIFGHADETYTLINHGEDDYSLISEWSNLSGRNSVMQDYSLEEFDALKQELA